jgi:hypothetical protein
MRPDEIGKILAESAHFRVQPGADRAAIDRAQQTILNDLQPVRELAAPWVFALAFLALFAALGIATGSVLGLHGIRALNLYQRALIFPTLLGTAWLAGVECAREMRPAAGLRLGTVALTFSVGSFLVVFSLIFHNYSTRNFVPEGVPCLLAGLYVAIPTGLGIAWIIRRGFVLNWSAAGLAAGALSGLTGLAMLELHCPNLNAIHVMVWHVAVVVVSAVLGFAIGRIAEFLRRPAR